MFRFILIGFLLVSIVSCDWGDETGPSDPEEGAVWVVISCSGDHAKVTFRIPSGQEDIFSAGNTCSMPGPCGFWGLENIPHMPHGIVYQQDGALFVDFAVKCKGAPFWDETYFACITVVDGTIQWLWLMDSEYRRDDAYFYEFRQACL